jgi:anaerobic selenocysteine-containing dehydrogenase
LVSNREEVKELESKFKVSRRTFLKAAAIGAVAASVPSSIGAHPALAESEDAAASAQDASEEKRIRSACRACGKMECGVWVIVKDGKAIRIEGDESAPGSRGNCCVKSQSSMQAAYHPDRLRYPMKRTNPKGEDPGWERISWDEAISLTTSKLGELKEKYGGDSVFCIQGTSRVYAMSIPAVTGMCFGTGNAVAAYEICKGPRHFASTLTDDFGSPWMETVMEPRVYLQWGTAPEYSNYDDSCRTVVDASQNASCHIAVDPRQGALVKEADIHLSVKPGTDCYLAMCWLNIVIQNKLYDELIVKRWTNGPFLYVADMEPSGGYLPDMKGGIEAKTRLLKECDLVEGGSVSRWMVYDNNWETLKNQGIEHEYGPLTWFDSSTGLWEHETEVRYPETGQWIDPPANSPLKAKAWLPDPSQFDPAIDPSIDSQGGYTVTLKDGTQATAVTVWEMFAERCAEYDLESVSEITGVDADLIENACLTWATKPEGQPYGNGGIHFQLATDQTGNSIHTSRALLILSHITDNYDTPGGNRGCTLAKVNATPGGPMMGPSVGNLPNDDPEKSNMKRFATMVGSDRFPLTAYFGMYSDANATYDAVLTGEPYPIRGALAATGNFMNQANCTYGWEALKSLDFFYDADLWHAPMSDLADVLVPATHWLETDSPRVSQGASGMIGATVKCIEPPGECKPDYEVTKMLIQGFGMPACTLPEYGDDPTNEQILDYCVANFEQAPTWQEYKQQFQENGWWEAKEVYPERWGTYRRYEMGEARQAASFYWNPSDGHQGFFTPTGKVEIWSVAIETYGVNGTYEGYQVTEKDCMPLAMMPMHSEAVHPELYEGDDTFYMTTGRRIPVYFHSEHRQLPWCRELWPVPKLEMNPADAERLGLQQGDWVWIENENGKIRETVDIYAGIDEGVVNAEHTWWYPEVTDCGRGWEHSAVNELVYRNDQDPICGSSTLRAYPVRVYKATAENSPFGDPVPCDSNGVEIIHDAKDERLKAWLPDYENRG